jgi:hypothetical protein
MKKPKIAVLLLSDALIFAATGVYAHAVYQIR